MMAADSSRQQLHVAIIPWLAFGHLLPCLELGERLASRGHRVSLVSTPRNLSRLRPVAALVDLVALPFPRVDGLPEGVEATSDLPPGKADLLCDALDRLAPSFSAFLGDGKVDWVILDNFHASIADVAAGHKVPCIMNMPYSAASSVAYGVPDPASSPMSRRFVHTLEKCKLIAYRSSFEFEPESMPHLTKIFGKPVIPVGLLPPPAGAKKGTDDASLSWLDEQPSKSVVYVAFGSEYPMTLKQLHEIAHGLELAGTRFLWALKRPNGLTGQEEALLPPGFEERMNGRGAVVTGWVPQTSILGHGAVGAFMFHCGWSSTIEGLQYGHPLAMMPVLGDQLQTARVMHERKIGVKVHKDKKDDEAFLGDNIASAIRALMVEKETKEIFAANAKKMQGIVGDNECHERYIDEFIQCMRTYKD